MKKKLMSMFLTMVLVIGSMTMMPSTSTKVEAASKKTAYGDSLKWKNTIKLNKTNYFMGVGLYKEESIFKRTGISLIKYTIKCQREEVGDNYQVTYNVFYHELNDPQLTSSVATNEDWFDTMVCPHDFFAVFDYQTGMTLENGNDKGVTIEESDLDETTYYPVQKVTCGDLTYGYMNFKTIEYSFVVTYPKTYKDVVVSIGLLNDSSVVHTDPDGNYEKYWNGEVPYGETGYYKKGMTNVCYMRLNK